MNIHTILDDPLARLIDDVVPAERCEALIAYMESLSPSAAPVTTSKGFVMRPDIRNNDRVMFDDSALASELFERLKDAFPQKWLGRELVGFNERFRGYKYSPGHRFAPHFDGAFTRDEHERSEFTVLLYLNHGYVGGATAFCDHGVRVVPRQGRVLMFAHRVRHEGSVVESGVKYVLRSDAMYRTIGDS